MPHLATPLEPETLEALEQLGPPVDGALMYDELGQALARLADKLNFPDDNCSADSAALRLWLALCLRYTTEGLVYQEMSALRERGVSFEAIGKIAGVSRPQAWKWYQRRHRRNNEAEAEGCPTC